MRHLLLTVILVVGCASKPASSASAPPSAPPPPAERKIEDFVGRPAPRFSLPSVRGDGTLTVPTGAVTVVTFFGTWSMGWQVALPALEALRKKHPGLRVVAVAMDEQSPKEVGERYAPLPIAWCGMGSQTNVDWLSGPYGGENKVFVIDRKGTIRFVHRGGKARTVFGTPEGAQSVEDEITTLLAEP
jgi:hypothetical protein